MDEYSRMVQGLKQVLSYLEEFAEESDVFAPEAEVTRLIVDAAERKSGKEILELLSRPMPNHYGGTGWRYVVSVGKELAASLCVRRQ